jgi:uncharacterized heparinase superfamily protein
MLRTASYLRPGQVASRLWYRARRRFFATRLYGRSLTPRGGGALLRVPPTLFPGDPVNGERLVAGRIGLLNLEHPLRAPADWHPADKSLLWLFSLHYFDWLDDLAALGGEAASLGARSLVADWMSGHARFDAVAWHPYPLSLRLHAWLRNAPLLLEGADGAFRDRFLVLLHGQVRHLSRVIERDVGGNHLLKNLKALVAAALCLPGHERAGESAVAELADQLRRQVPADGAHYERSPSYHVQVLCDLLETRALMELAGGSPPWLSDAIARMAGAYATYRLGDGLLALFNDGSVGEPRLLAALDAALGGAPLPRGLLAQAGYARLAAGDVVVLFDAGRCSPDELPGHAHADTLSFEMSCGAERLVVNCGTYAYQDPVWRPRLRATAAHSTVGVPGRDSAEVYAAFRLGRRPRRVVLTVPQSGEGRVAEGEHDGYAHLGLGHRRRLELDAGGRGLTGVDELRHSRGGPLDVEARFHLHPAVSIESTDDVVMLRLPSGARWRFRCAAGSATVEPSVYAPDFYRMETTRQIVVRARVGGDPVVLRWRLEREN